jgi:hypothetical protein
MLFLFLMVAWIRDPKVVKTPDLGSGMNIPDHIAESLEKFFWVK